MPVRMNYLYRDGSNCKQSGSILFSGSYTEDQIDAMRDRLAIAMDDRNYFVASQVRVPEVFLWDGMYEPNECDNGWHEMGEVFGDDGEAFDEDVHERTFEQFVLEVEAVGGKWAPPEPPVSYDDEEDAA